MSKSDPIRVAVWVTVFLLALVAAAIMLLYFPRNHPEQTLKIEAAVTAFFRELTLPIKEARLAMQDPDATFLMPVYGASVSQVADTWHAARGSDRQHEGQDIFAPKGTPIFSATKGFVRRVGISELGGNIVFVTGAGGRRYYYAHLDEIAEGLAMGQEVTTDTVLGFVGQTGNAATTPPHLHFGMYERRQALNPLPLLMDRS